MSSKNFDESIESIDRRIAQLRARRRDEVARHERRERNARTFACMVLGRRLVDWAGDWHRVDPARVDSILAGADPSLVADGEAGALSTTQALKRLHEGERGRDEAEERAELESYGGTGE